MDMRSYSNGRYLLFGMNGEQALGGFGDFMFSFNSASEGRTNLDLYEKANQVEVVEIDCYQIADTVKRTFTDDDLSRDQLIDLLDRTMLDPEYLESWMQDAGDESE